MTPAQRLRAAAQLAPQVIQPHKVALAVAAWLEQVATTMEAFSGASFDVAWNYALVVADALLQTQPVKP